VSNKIHNLGGAVRIQHSQVNEKWRSPCHALNAPGVNRHGSVAMNQPIEDFDVS